MALRKQVLTAFRQLHRTCRNVFNGDATAIAASRKKINCEFKRFKSETDPKKIDEHVQWARDAERLFRLTVVQAKLKDDGSTYEARVTRDTYRGKNVMFNPDPDFSNHRTRR